MPTSPRYDNLIPTLKFLKVKALSEASAPLAQRMYEEEAKNKEASDQEDQNNDSDVVDADFEEVTEEKENQNH